MSKKSETFMLKQYLADQDQKELVAELICSDLPYNVTHEIDSKGEIYFTSDIGHGVIEFNIIIRVLYEFLMLEISKVNFNDRFVWDHLSYNIKKQCIEAARDSISREYWGVIWKVEELAGQIKNLTDNKIWEEYLNIGNSDEVLVQDTMYLEPIFDEIGNLAETYLELPFRDKDFEVNLLRIFYYAFASTAWFRITQEVHPYHIHLSARIKDFRNYVYIYDYRISTKCSPSHNLIYLNEFYRAFSPFLVFLLPYWYLNFPNYLEKDFYLAFSIGLYLSFQINRHNEKKANKKYRHEKKMKDKLVKCSKNISQMMSFSVEGGPIPVGDLLKKNMISMNFGKSKLSVPRPLIDILKRSKRDNDGVVSF